MRRRQQGAGLGSGEEGLGSTRVVVTQDGELGCQGWSPWSSGSLIGRGRVAVGGVGENNSCLDRASGCVSFADYRVSNPEASLGSAANWFPPSGSVSSLLCASVLLPGMEVRSCCPLIYPVGGIGGHGEWGTNGGHWVLSWAHSPGCRRALGVSVCGQSTFS